MLVVQRQRVVPNKGSDHSSKNIGVGADWSVWSDWGDKTFNYCEDFHNGLSRYPLWKWHCTLQGGCERKLFFRFLCSALTMRNFCCHYWTGLTGTSQLTQIRMLQPLSLSLRLYSLADTDTFLTPKELKQTGLHTALLRCNEEENEPYMLCLVYLQLHGYNNIGQWNHVRRSRRIL